MILQVYCKELRVLPRNKTETTMQTVKNGFVFLGLCLVLHATGMMGMHSAFAQEVSLNQALTTAAWGHFGAQEYEAAIAKAEECIEMFHVQADSVQAELTNNQVPFPQSIPATEKEREEIVLRGRLNDVATSYFIIGQAYERLGNEAQAMEAYRAADALKHAMAWDPKGWFWNVSGAAADRLRYLEKEK